MKIKVTCNHCKKRYLVEKNTRNCPKCKKPIKNSYKHEYSLKEDTSLDESQKRKQLLQIKFYHIVYTFVLGVALYIGVIIVQFSNITVKNKASSKRETSNKNSYKLSNVLTINSTSRGDDVFGYFQYISKEIDSLNSLKNSIDGQTNEEDIKKMRDIIFRLSLKIEETNNKKVPSGYENIHLNFQKKIYYREKYFQNYYDYILSKDPNYIEKINNFIQKENETWKLVLDELEVELKKDGFNTYRMENGINISYEKVRYGF